MGHWKQSWPSLDSVRTQRTEERLWGVEHLPCGENTVQHGVTDLHAVNQSDVTRIVRVGGWQGACQGIGRVIHYKKLEGKSTFENTKSVEWEMLCDHVCKHLSAFKWCWAVSKLSHTDPFVKYDNNEKVEAQTLEMTALFGWRMTFWYTLFFQNVYCTISKMTKEPYQPWQQYCRPDVRQAWDRRAM